MEYSSLVTNEFLLAYLLCYCDGLEIYKTDSIEALLSIIRLKFTCFAAAGVLVFGDNVPLLDGRLDGDAAAFSSVLSSSLIMAKSLADVF